MYYNVILKYKRKELEMLVPVITAIHVVTVLLWIGGVSFVTIIIFPMLVRMGDSLEKVLMFQSVENVFVRLARYYVVVVGITGFLLLYLTDQFSKLFTMETLGITFMLIVWGLYSFILLFERKIFAKLFADSKKYDPDKIMVRLSRGHWVILALSLVAVFMGVLVNHSKNLF